MTQKTNPIPTRFDEEEDALIKALKIKTGLAYGDVVRRCVRFFAAELKRRPDWNWLEETAPRSEPVAHKIPHAPRANAAKAPRRKTG